MSKKRNTGAPKIMRNFNNIALEEPIKLKDRKKYVNRYITSMR